MMEFGNLRAKSPFSLTDRAAGKIEQMKMELTSNVYLRLGVRKRLQSNFSYFLKFDEIQDADYKVRVGGVDFVIHASHVMYATGVKIDFVNGVFKISPCLQKKIMEWGKIENIYYP